MTRIFTAIALFVAVLGFANSASAREVTFVINAPANQVYIATLRVVNGLDGYEVKNSDREAGLIAAEHKVWSGEANQFLNVEISQVGEGRAELKLNIRKRKFSVSGGNIDERIKEFHGALSRQLGDKVTVTVKDGK